MTDARPPKKSDTLEVRMPHGAKRAFIEACRKEGRNASEVVRDFVEGYLARNAAGRADERAWDPTKSARSLAMSLLTPKGRRGMLAAGVGALGLIAMSVSPSAAEIDFRAMYDQLDADRDGKVTLEEFAAPRSADAVRGDVVMFFQRETTTTVDGAPLTENQQMFWMPAPPPEEGAAPGQPMDRQVQIVRRVDGQELITEEIQPLPEEAVRELKAREFSTFDENDDGAVDYAEFEGRHRAMLEGTFHQIDADGNGVVSAEEMNGFPAIMLVRADIPAPPASPSPFTDRAFSALDHDGDGGVSLEEFAAGPANP